jgi:hypothetical protein
MIFILSLEIAESIEPVNNQKIDRLRPPLIAHLVFDR